MNTFNDNALVASISQLDSRGVWSSVDVQEQLWRFQLVGTLSVSGINTALPIDVVATGTNAGFVAARDTSGVAWIAPVTFSTSASLSLASSNTNRRQVSANPTSLRGSFDATGHYYTAQWTWGGTPTIYKGTLSGGSYTQEAWGNGAPIGVLEASATFMRRVDAVCYTPIGMIVAVGSYNYAAHIATQAYYLLTEAGAVIRLEQQLQQASTDAYSAWHNSSVWGAFTQATNNERDMSVVSFDGRRAWQFRCTFGMASEREQVVQIDDDAYADDVLPAPTFQPTSLTKVGSLYYLSAAFKRPMSDNSFVWLETYLTSSDMQHWSVGEYSSFVTKSQVLGSMVSDGTYAFHAGHGTLYRAPLRPLDGAGEPTDLSVYATSAEVSFGESIAADGSVDFLHYADIAAVKPGAILRVSAGYMDGVSHAPQGGVLGTFAVDAKPSIITEQGRSGMAAPLLDLASWRLKQWSSPIDVDRWSRNVTEVNDFSKAGALLIRSAQRDVAFAASGFSSVALNDPFVAQAALRDERDGLQQALVRFTNPDQYSLTSFGMMFGGDASGNFNAAMIPLPNAWGEHTQSQVKVLRAQRSDFDYDRRLTGLWESVLDSALMQGLSQDSTYYYPTAASAFSRDVDYEFSVRESGRRVQIYAREHKTGYDEMAFYANSVLIAETRFTAYDRQHFTQRPYRGFVCGTDVWASRNAFQQAAYGDMDLVVTGAGNYSDFAVNMGPCQRHSDSPKHFVNGTFSWMQPGMHIKIGGEFHTVDHVDGTGLYVVDDSVHPPFEERVIWRNSVSEVWGYASSDYTKTDIEGTAVYTDPGASLTNTAVAGEAFFMTDDSTAGSLRRVVSDGVHHYVYSGSTTETHEAWDSTAVAANWRMVFHHGRFFVGKAEDFGLDPTAYFLVDDEKIRYVNRMALKRGDYNQNLESNQVWWCAMPVLYAPLAGTTGPSTNLRNWRHTSDAQPGDDLGTLEAWFGGTPNVTNYGRGMLAEIKSRTSHANVNIDSAELAPVYRVASSTYIASPDVNNTSYVTLDTQYPHAISGPGDTGGALIVLSGRAQLGSSKGLHASDAPVVRYPLPMTDPAPLEPLQDLIRVKRYGCYTGRYYSLEEALRYTCALSGVRDVQFRSRATWAGTLDTNIVTLTSTDLSDFVLDLDAHLYAHTDNGLAGEGRLRISFRSSYSLDVQVWRDPALIASGRHGALRLLLQCPASAMDIAGEAKWLDIIVVPIADVDLSGLTSGGTHTEDPSVKHRFRLVVRKHLISFEFEGVPVWTFNLKNRDYVNASGVSVSNYFQTAGPVTIQYVAGGEAAASARIMELGQEVESHVVDMGSTGLSALSDLLGDRHVVSRATQGGGIEFSHFLTRDLAQTVTANSEQLERLDSPLEPVGHLNVSGAEFGEYADEAWMQANGYRFGSASNRLLDTVQDSVEEARLLQRQSKEYATQHTLRAAGFLIPQPGDVLSVAFGSSGTSLPYMLAHEFVVGQITLALTPEAIQGEYQLREYYE